MRTNPYKKRQPLLNNIQLQVIKIVCLLNTLTKECFIDTILQSSGTSVYLLSVNYQGVWFLKTM